MGDLGVWPWRYRHAGDPAPGGRLPDGRADHDFGGAVVAKVNFYRAEMDWLLKNPSGTVGRFMSRIGRDIRFGAQRMVGVKTGALRASIHMRHTRDSRGQYVIVGSNLHYAYMHHEGTRPHVIRPSRAKMLKFMSRGQMIFAHRALHPGTKPNPYLRTPMRTVVTATNV